MLQNDLDLPLCAYQLKYQQLHIRLMPPFFTLNEVTDMIVSLLLWCPQPQWAMMPCAAPLPRLRPRWCSGWALLTLRSSLQPVPGSSRRWGSCSSTSRLVQTKDERNKSLKPLGLQFVPLWAAESQCSNRTDGVHCNSVRKNAEQLLKHQGSR